MGNKPSGESRMLTFFDLGGSNPNSNLPVALRPELITASPTVRREPNNIDITGIIFGLPQYRG